MKTFAKIVARSSLLLCPFFYVKQYISDSLQKSRKRILHFNYQCFLWTEIRAFAAFYTFVVVYDGRVKACLRKRADRAHFNCRARVILRTVVLNQYKRF